jgi:hypothetical protein
VAGLAALVWLNVAILRAASRSAQRSFFGMWMLPFTTKSTYLAFSEASV